MSNYEVTLSIPRVLNVPIGENDFFIGRYTQVPIDTFDKKVLTLALVNGFTKALTDISRGKDENERPLSDDMWEAKRAKRADAWKRGLWKAHGEGSRGDSNTALMRELWIDEAKKDYGWSTLAAESFIKDKVAEFFGDEDAEGKKIRATFDKFMLAMAMEECESDDPEDEDVVETYNSIDDFWTVKAEETRKMRAEVAKEVKTDKVKIVMKRG